MSMLTRPVNVNGSEREQVTHKRIFLLPFAFRSRLAKGPALSTLNRSANQLNVIVVSGLSRFLRIEI
jgi:hypothetical protein